MRRAERPDPLEEYKLRALDEYLPRSMVAFTMAGSAMVASGTLVSIGDDVVVATAGHVVRGLIVPDVVNIRLLSEPVLPRAQGVAFTERRRAIETCLCSPVEPLFPDVGAVILSRADAADLRSRALPLAALDDPRRRLLLEEHQRLCGFPAALTTAATFRSLLISTVVQDPCGADHSRARAEGVHDASGLHVDWSMHDSNGIWTNNWNAQGMSGGSLWSVGRTVSHQVWEPRERARLIGIAFFEDDRGSGAGCVRAVPITEWAQLLHRFAEDVERPEWRHALEISGLVSDSYL